MLRRLRRGSKVKYLRELRELIEKNNK